MVPHVLAEQGCIEYGPTLDLDTPVTGGVVRANTVICVEKWTDMESLQAHFKAPHMKEFRETSKGLSVGMKLQILQTAQKL